MNDFECIPDSTDNFALIIKERKKSKDHSFSNQQVKCDGLIPVENYFLKFKTECLSNQTEYLSTTGITFFLIADRETYLTHVLTCLNLKIFILMKRLKILIVLNIFPFDSIKKL